MAGEKHIGTRSGTLPGVHGPKTRFPVVVPPLPRMTTGYRLSTLRVGLHSGR